MVVSNFILCCWYLIKYLKPKRLSALKRDSDICGSYIPDGFVSSKWLRNYVKDD